MVAAVLRYGLLASGYLHHCRLITYKSDDYEYHTLAVNLLKEHRFYLPDPRPGWQTRRTPGFPLLLAGIYAVTGPSPYRAAAVLVLISLAICAVTYALGTKLFDSRTGLTAGLLMAVSPAGVLYAGLILTDSLHALLVTLSFLSLFSVWKSTSLRTSITAGLVLGTAMLVRPVSQFLPAITSALALSLRSGRAVWLWAPVISYALVVPWCIRNYAVAGQFHLSSVGTYNMVSYNLVYANAAATGKDPDEVRRKYLAQATSASETRSLVAREGRLYWRRLIANQLTGAVLYWFAPDRGMWQYFFGSRNRVTGALDMLWSTRIVGTAVRVLKAPAGTIAVAQACFNVATALAGVAGVILCIIRKRNRPASVLALCWCLYYAVLTGPVAVGRYRMPADPLLMVYASVFLHGAVCRIRRKTEVAAESS